MATTRDGGRFVLPAGADLSGSQYLIVVETSGEAQLASGATNDLLGVLQNAPVENDSAEVLGRHASGTGKVKLGGTVAVGDELTTNASGEAIVTTTSGNEVFGVARQAGVDGDIIEYEPVRKTVD